MLYTTARACSLLLLLARLDVHLQISLGDLHRRGRCFLQLFVVCRREINQRFKVMLNLFPVARVSHLCYRSSIAILVPLGTPRPSGPSCPRTVLQQAGAGDCFESKNLRTTIPHLSIRTEVASSEQSPLELSRGCFRKKIRREQSCLFLSPASCCLACVRDS